MSAYIEGTVSIKDKDCLIAALVEMGYAAKNIEVHETGQNLYGYRGDKRSQTAEVIVRRKHVGSASNDLGFAYDGKEWKAIVSAYDTNFLKSKHSCGGSFLDEVSTRAAVIAAERKMKKRGFTTTRKQEGRKIRLVVHS